jgi:hypothetical protein
MAKTGDGDFLRTIAESVLQIIMEPTSTAWSALAGTNVPATARRGAMAIATAASIPGSARSTSRSQAADRRLLSGFLEPRKTVEKALVAVIQEAWIAGVSTRAWMNWSRPWV